MFRFRLSGILHLKGYKELLCRDETAKCLQMYRAAVELQSELQTKLLVLENQFMVYQKGKIDIRELIFKQDYKDYIESQFAKQQVIVKHKQEQLNIAKQKLAEAIKEKKVLEKLREKKYQQYRYEKDKIEQALLDEIANRK